MEIWGIFDFLMPGYLGEGLVFKQFYQKNFDSKQIVMKNDEIIFSATQKKTLDTLHKRILPFVMRRNKQQVLKDLPEKIIQDVYCEMSPLQEKLYKEFVQCEIPSTQ